jgi:hypothetical protein
MVTDLRNEISTLNFPNTNQNTNLSAVTFSVLITNECSLLLLITNECSLLLLIANECSLLLLIPQTG